VAVCRETYDWIPDDRNGRLRSVARCALAARGAIDKGGGEVCSRSEAHGRCCRRWQLGYRAERGVLAAKGSSEYNSQRMRVLAAKGSSEYNSQRMPPLLDRRWDFKPNYGGALHAKRAPLRITIASWIFWAAHAPIDLGILHRELPASARSGRSLQPINTNAGVV
jgi:hypothetical protein